MCVYDLVVVCVFLFPTLTFSFSSCQVALKYFVSETKFA